MYGDLYFTMFSQILVISCRQNFVSGLWLSIHLEEINSLLSMFIESGMFKVAISFRHFSITVSLGTFPTAISKCIHKCVRGVSMMHECCA